MEERLPQETQRCIVVSKCGEMAFAIYIEVLDTTIDEIISEESIEPFKKGEF